MKRIFIIALLIILFNNLLPERIKKIKIPGTYRNQIINMIKAGIPSDDIYFNRKDNSAYLFANEYELEKIESMGMSYEILIDDWYNFYDSQSVNLDLQKVNAKQLTKEVNVTNFDYGSMGGFYTNQEVLNKLDSMHLKYPELITQKFKIGTTVEGRPIYAIKISDNPDIDEDEPEVFYNALIHAREPQSMMTVMFFMYYLLENYEVDPSVKYLVDNREFYFVPVINVDGYEYNRISRPQGGGFWRKNRHINDSIPGGIDLNRNFGYMWGFDNIGSSPNVNNETYRGLSPFSEPETQAIRDFCNNRNFRAALNYHSFGNLLIYPWGYTNKETSDSALFRDYAADMTLFNNFEKGNSVQLLYLTNGDSDDWMYGDQTSKPKIIAMTPEVGNDHDGFWPTVDRIIPIALENLYPNLYLAWIAGDFVKLASWKFDSTYIFPGEKKKLSLTVMNKGLTDASGISININSLSNNAEIQFSRDIPGMVKSRESINLPIDVSILSSAKNLDSCFIEVKVFSHNSLMSSDTIQFRIGKPEYVFYDKCDRLDSLWLTSWKTKWETTQAQFFSYPSCYTDSKVGNYKSNDSSYIELKNAFDISNLESPVLSFSTKYNIEKGYDYAQVKVSSDNGETWKSLKCPHSNTENYTLSDEPVFDGAQEKWITEEIDISEFKSQQFKIKFEMHSDSYSNADGWYIDDIGIFSKSDNTVSVNQKHIPEFRLEQNYPNPFNPSTVISYQLSVNSLVTLRIYDTIGNEVAALVNEEKPAGKYSIEWKPEGVASGIYFIRIKAGNFTAVRKMIYMK